ncbi:threonylcarbamoyl-AMP synthase [bacterium]|nr:threonylcarbamoyl-AMP synthase [bacterium]
MTKPLILKINKYNPEHAILKMGVSTLKKGEIVAFPTDTFYALGADSSNFNAFDRIYDIKKRNRSQPFTLLVNSIDMILPYVTGFDSTSKKLSDAFFPGKLTMVFKAAPNIPKHLVSSDGTISFRVPDSNLCREMIKKLGNPVTGTSANLSGMKPARSVKEVLTYFKGVIDLILDGGYCSEEKPSTLIDVTKNPPEILRSGAISHDDIKKVLAD